MGGGGGWDKGGGAVQVAQGGQEIEPISVKVK